MSKHIKTSKPLVSVIMPVYNACGYLVESLDSICNQSITNWELICINDASTDNSLAILKQYQKQDKRIKIYSNSVKMGISYSLNKAIGIAKGTYIARMDADDVSLPQRFEKQITLLKENPRLVACGGQAVMIDNKSAVFAYKSFPQDPKTLYNMIMSVVPIQHPILMAKAEVLKNYRYNENEKTAEDVDMLFCLLSKGDISNVNTIVYKYRKTDRSNGYHNVKKTFYITLRSRLVAIFKHGYRPTPKGILISLLQCIMVTLLPSKSVVTLFEAMRFEPPIWQRGILKFLQPAI